MAIQLNQIYQKSAAGREEIQRRSGAIDARTRSALILINGKDPLAAVERQLGHSIVPSVQSLLDLGLVEVVSRREPAPVQADPPQTPSQPSPDEGAKQGHWEAVKRQIAVRLAPHFGPDLMTVLAPLMAAQSDTDKQAAMQALQAKLALYLGRKAAAKIFEDLNP